MCYLHVVKQLITRMDDDLHEQLKRRAQAEHRSVNALVIEALTALVQPATPRAALRDRARSSSRLVTPEQPRRVPSWAALERATKGAGSAASDALADERAAR
jgi:plasmid stability protein